MFHINSCQGEAPGPLEKGGEGQHGEATARRRGARRARTVGVRVTATEEAELRERAQAARLSMGAYLRRRALGQRVRIAAELRLGEGRLDKPSPGRMPALGIS